MQSITEVRKALGEENQTLIRTVVRRGYLLGRPSDRNLHRSNRRSRFSVSPIKWAARPTLRWWTTSGGHLKQGGALPDCSRTRPQLWICRAFGWLGRLVRDRPAAESRFPGARHRAPSWRIDRCGRRSDRDDNGQSPLGRKLYGEGADLFAVQDDIARRIVNWLVARLEDAGMRASASKSSANVVAYEFLLR
jgi:hypothetical protein